jgi:diguanylate cyclase (GGDEF)-like protein
MIALQEGNEIVDAMLEVELSINLSLYDQALEQLEEVAERYPRYIPAKEVLADLFRKKGNAERADEILREARLVSEQIACEHCEPDIESELSGVDPSRRLTERVEEIVRRIYESSKVDAILRISAALVQEALSADRCIILCVGQKWSANFEHCREETEPSLDQRTAKLNFLISRRIARSAGLVVIDNPLEDPTLATCRQAMEQLKIRALMACPMVHSSHIIGFVAVHDCDRSKQWSEFERNLLSGVAGHMAVAIANARQFGDLGIVVNTDNVTGLHNRSLFDSRFSVELRNAQQQRYPLCLAILHVDSTSCNCDPHPDSGGDQVFHRLGFLLRTNLRRGTVIARYEGGRFTILLPHADLKIGCRVMDKIRALAERAVTTDSGESITVSIGLGNLDWASPGSLQNIQDELIQKATENLEEAIRSRRHRVSNQSESAGETYQC